MYVLKNLESILLSGDPFYFRVKVKQKKTNLNLFFLNSLKGFLLPLIDPVQNLLVIRFGYQFIPVNGPNSLFQMDQRTQKFVIS